MHLVCLGVMRRLLRNWVSQGFGRRLSRQQRENLNDLLRSCSKRFPSNFQRKPRGTEELDRWKATEFRSFLLYVGPVVLKHVLPNDQYRHFLMLHVVAVRILVYPAHYEVYNGFARDLLRYFVQEFGTLYGAKQLVYNVHTLSHLAEQCLDHGFLDSFSAFPFESFLGKVKKMLRSTSKPLAQISRRMSEVRHLYQPEISERKRIVKAGQCFMLNESAVVVLKLLEDRFKASILPNMTDFFELPIKSSAIGIWQCDSLTHVTKMYNLSELDTAVQYLRLDYRSRHVILPLLHLL
ncbi:uncharacterized protein LOC121046507 [Ixodes scapularis]|uniref:uncharacterized protein LOC121046507 n=1 Tax=Ixodes scapularis TaxID=6945 RepID=UPI001AD6ACBD|nr:uncharacterized protein LOC121046507 [Ixodes scapularis]